MRLLTSTHWTAGWQNEFSEESNRSPCAWSCGMAPPLLRSRPPSWRRDRSRSTGLTGADRRSEPLVRRSVYGRPHRGSRGGTERGSRRSTYPRNSCRTHAAAQDAKASPTWWNSSTTTIGMCAASSMCSLRRLHRPVTRTPEPLRPAVAVVGRALMHSAAFTRHVVINRWFLRA